MSATAPQSQFARRETPNERADDFFKTKIDGRNVTIFRRVVGGKRTANYSVKFELARRTIFRGLGVDTKGFAREEAAKIVRAALKARDEDRWEDFAETKLREDAPVATIGQLAKAYSAEIAKFSLRIEPKTVRNNVATLRRVIAYALGMTSQGGAEKGRARYDAEAIDRLSSAVLTEELAEKFLAAYVGRANGDRVLRESRIRGAVSLLNQAMSMFSEQALKCYRGLRLPELKGFLKVALPATTKPPQRHMERETIREIARAALALRESNPALYLVHLLFRQLGMRNDEIEHARGTWIERAVGTESRPAAVWLPNGERREIAAYMVIKRRPEWEPKQSEGEIPIAPDVLAEIDGVIAGRGLEEFLIAAPTPTARWELINKAHNDFVRPWTSEHRKKGYELRRWASTLTAMRQGKEMGERFLRHKDASVAGEFYFTAQVPPAPVTLGDCGL